MARIRTIKPEFFTSEDIVAMTPLARLLYVALWCEADKEGRLVWKPRTMKLRYFPADACDIDALSNELISGGLVRLYGEGLAFIPAFTTHQHVNPRESGSQLPPPDEKLTRRHASARVNSGIDPQGGREGKGKEGKARDASGDPAGFADLWAVYPNRKAKQDAIKAWMKIEPDEELQGIIIKAVLAQSISKDWLKDDGAYVPHAATWLNGKRWQDEVATADFQGAFL